MGADDWIITISGDECLHAPHRFFVQRVSLVLWRVCFCLVVYPLQFLERLLRVGIVWILVCNVAEASGQMRPASLYLV